GPAPPIPPAQLAVATLLQAYTRAADDEVIAATTMDRRWQLVLACRACQEAPFSNGALIAFRQRLIASGQDRRLERTVERAEATGGCGPRALRAALDSSPLWSVGREEIRPLLAEVAAEAGGVLLSGARLKATLDRDGDDLAAREQALAKVLAARDAVES